MYFTTDSTWNQSVIFISMLFAGMVLGLIFSFINGEKQYIKKKIWKNVHDAAFCIIMFFVVGTALYVVDNVKIDTYMVLALLAGFFASRMLFEKTVRNAINKANTLINLIKIRLNKKEK